MLAPPGRHSPDQGGNVPKESQIGNHALDEGVGDRDQRLGDAHRIRGEPLRNDGHLGVEPRHAVARPVVSQKDDVEGVGRVAVAQPSQEAPRGVARARLKTDQGVGQEQGVEWRVRGMADGLLRMMPAGSICRRERLGYELQAADVRAAAVGEKNHKCQAGARGDPFPGTPTEIR